MPGIGDFDANAAAANLAAVGQPAPMMGPPVPPPAPGPILGPPVPPGVGPVEGPPAPPGVDTSQIVQPAPVAPPGPSGAPPVIVPSAEGGGIPGIQAASVAAQKAAGEQGQAEADLAAAKGAEEAKAAKIHEAEAEELRQQNEQQARAQDEAHRQTEAALNQAHAATIPAFFASNEGKRAETAMWVGLGGIAQGLLGSSTNGAADVVSKNVDAYYRREKDRIDNLFTYAAKKGEAEGELRLQHTQQLAGLQAQFGATKLAIASRIDAIATAGQGRIDQAKAQELAAKYALDGQKDIGEAQYRLAQIAHLRAEDARAREKAKMDRSAANEAKEVKPISAEFDKDEARLMGTARTPGLIAQQQAIRELGDTLRDAVKSGDPTRIKAAIVQNKEKIARLNTGAAPSHEQMKMLNDLSGTPAEVEEKLNSLMGNPKAAQQTIKSILDLTDASDEGALKQIDKARQGIVTKYIGNSGIAKTKAQREHVQGRLGGLFSQVTTRGGGARYQEGGATAAETKKVGDSTYIKSKRRMAAPGVAPKFLFR